MSAQPESGIKTSDLEAKFDYYWRVLNGPPLEPEYRFCHRRWRFDRAHLGTKVAIECDGGTYRQGRHSREPGYSNDCEKMNFAACEGWRVFRLTSKMLNENPVKHLTGILRAIGQ